MNRFVTALFLSASLTGCAGHLRAELDAARAAADAADARCKEDIAKALADADLSGKRLAAYKLLADKFRKAFDTGDLTIEIRDGRLIVKLPNSIRYDTRRSTLKPEGKEMLTKIASVLSTEPDRRFLIAGHTDNQPVSAKSTTFKTNWELSAQRALAALYYLETKSVPAKQMAAAGYGEFQPAAPNDTDANKALNRRTEIQIMPTIDEIPKLPANL